MYHQEMIYHGGKGGSEKSHTPVETPNNLLSVATAKILIAVAEGELAKRPTGRDIFLDGTPLINADGSSNFGGVKWDWRPGTQNQGYIKGLPDVSSEFNVGVELTQANPWTRLITKPTLDAVRITFQWPAIQQQKSNGDTVGLTIKYGVDISTDGGAFVRYRDYEVSGKTNTAYERTTRIDLPDATTGWTIRAVRLSPESASSTVQDTMNIKSYTEVVDRKQRYPNTALLFVEFDSRTFPGGSIPRVSVRTQGRLVRVPANYDPETRTYSGVWNGVFKWAATDNPAWVFYDIVTQERFGLGNKVSVNQVDKWALYELAQYCDVMVDDGTGSGKKEPRHTCNIYIQEQADAWQVLRDVAAISNSMTYWNGNQFVAVPDKQENLSNLPVFSRSNVVDGVFNYQASDDKSIYTSAIISYDDKDNHFNSATTATWERSEILRWGADRQVSLSALGCTSRGEAQRKGKYTLITNIYNRTVKFQTGLQGMDNDIKPGRVVHVVDPLIAGRQFTGRIKIATGRVITLDRPLDVKSGDILFITKKDGTSQGRTVSLSSSGNVVTVSTAYSEQPIPNAVWYHEATDLKSQLFRVTKITSPAESVFEIEAVEYNDSKYGAVDNGARLESRPISVVPPGAQQAPTTVIVTSKSYIEQTMAVSTMTISWQQTKNAVSYEGQWKVGDSDWINAGTTGALEFNIKGIYTGQYVARVRAINALGVKSVWTNSVLTDLNGKEGAPPTLASLTVTPLVFGMRLNWQFKPGSSDTARTEIFYSQTTSFNDAIKLGDFAYPQDTHQLHGLKAGVTFFFWARLIDRTGNIGEWYPLDSEIGIIGQTSVDQTEYEEYFLGQINESALGKDLFDKIESIDGLQSQIDALNGLKAYDQNTAYLKGQMVVVDGRIYQALSDIPANPDGSNSPPNVLLWQDIGQLLETTQGLVLRVDKTELDITELDGIVTAQGSTLESLKASYREDDGTGALNDAMNLYESNASFTQQIKVVATEGEATASRVTQLTSEVGEVQSNITTLEQTTATKFEAQATINTQLTSEVGNNKSAIEIVAQTQANTDNELSAMWSVKMELNSQGQYVAAGIGLGIENGPAGLQSQFLVRADRFAVVNGVNSATSAPFVVEGTQTFIRDAFIKDGTITNAKIGSFISSTNYVANTTGWRLDKSGTFEINGTAAGQGRLTMTNQRLRIYHPNGVLAVDLGINV